MASETALLWSFLHFLTKPRYDLFMKTFGSLESARKNLSREMLEELGCREETISTVLERAEKFDPGKYSAELQSLGIRFFSIEDEDYPEMLRQIGDPPVFLYAKGNLEILKQPCIGLVGTRRMTVYGKRVTEEFVPAFVGAGMTTVSGLAFGIDACVAHATLASGGKTVAVLAHGLHSVYPRSHGKLAERIHQADGLLLSEFPLDYEPGKFTFPARNRIIAGLSLGTVVFEAPVDSGAIITAELALEYGRDVFAVPGQIFDPTFAGTNKLIATGQAKLVTSAAQVMEEIGIISSASETSSRYIARNVLEEELLRILTRMPQRLDDLLERSTLDAGTLSATLTMMELSGGAMNVGGGMWVRN